MHSIHPRVRHLLVRHESEIERDRVTRTLQFLACLAHTQAAAPARSFSMWRLLAAARRLASVTCSHTPRPTTPRFGGCSSSSSTSSSSTSSSSAAATPPPVRPAPSSRPPRSASIGSGSAPRIRRPASTKFSGHRTPGEASRGTARSAQQQPPPPSYLATEGVVLGFPLRAKSPQVYQVESVGIPYRKQVNLSLTRRFPMAALYPPPSAMSLVPNEPMRETSTPPPSTHTRTHARHSVLAGPSPIDPSIVVPPPKKLLPPMLCHGLRQVLASPGVHPLRPLSQSTHKYNFSNFLSRIHPPDRIAYERLPTFVRPSEDAVRLDLSISGVRQ